MGQEIDGEVLGEEYKGYIFKITGGNDKQGFPMKQGVLVNGRVRLLLKKSKCLLHFLDNKACSLCISFPSSLLFY
jgi:hypothetical protein